MTDHPMFNKNFVALYSNSPMSERLYHDNLTRLILDDMDVSGIVTLELKRTKCTKSFESVFSCMVGRVHMFPFHVFLKLETLKQIFTMSNSTNFAIQ